MRFKLKSWTGVRCPRGLGLRLHPNSLGRISQLLICFFCMEHCPDAYLLSTPPQLLSPDFQGLCYHKASGFSKILHHSN